MPSESTAQQIADLKADVAHYHTELSDLDDEKREILDVVRDLDEEIKRLEDQQDE